MGTNILLSPVGSNKTRSVLRSLMQTCDQQPLAKVWVLLATKRQENAFRQQLATQQGAHQVYFNIEFFNFYELYQHLLDLAAVPTRHLGETARLAVLRAILSREKLRLGVYAPIVETPGFLRIITAFIDELKQNSIYPEDFALGDTSPAGRDLALIYAAYQAELQKHQLMDTEGAGWLALEALRDDPTLADDLSLLLVDGYDQFTPVQADLLVLLADRTPTTQITLTTVPGREATIGRRFAQALEQLQMRFDARSLTVDTLLDQTALDKHPDLYHLLDAAFLPGVVAAVSSGGIDFLEAPDPAQETAAVLRHVKRLLIDGVPPDEILIVLRDWGRYRVHFNDYMQRYGLPLVLHYGEALADNPVVHTLLAVLELHALDFPRRHFLDLLRSPYIRWPGLMAEDIDLLEQISLHYRVVKGRDQWLDALDMAVRSQALDDDDDVPGDALCTVEDAARLKTALNAIYAGLTPPQNATVPALIAWIETLIGEDPLLSPDDGDEFDDPTANTFSLSVIACIRAETAWQGVISRDLGAMVVFKQTLRGMLGAQHLVENLMETQPARPDSVWEAFWTELLTAINTAAVNPRPERSGRVLVTTATDARGLTHGYVFIMGLSEGVFPAQIPDDPLYLDSERLVLKQAGLQLQTAVERSADDGLFYELLSLPRDCLILSRPTTQEGKPWLASPLWRAVADCFIDARSLIAEHGIGLSDVIAPLDAASVNEAAAAAIHILVGAHETAEVDAAGVWAWLAENYPDACAHVATMQRLELGRLMPGRFDVYTGRLHDGALIEQVARQLNSERVWSASQFNDYGTCGFRFFAKRLLHLEALEEPEVGMDVMQRGSVMHRILEETYKHLIGHAIQPDNLEHALHVLDEVAETVCATAPQEYGFRESPLWEQEKAQILRQLEGLIRRDFSGEGPIDAHFGAAGVPRKPYQMEAVFGRRDAHGRYIPAQIDLGGDVGTVRILGYIDRIDQVGDDAVIVDYKSGSTPIPLSELQAGRNFQMMVYLAGAEAVLQAEQDPNRPRYVEGGAFWHLRNLEASGNLHNNEAGETVMQEAREHLARYIAAGRRGDFAVQPNKPDPDRCIRYCEFYQLCRISSTNANKI